MVRFIIWSTNFLNFKVSTAFLYACWTNNIDVLFINLFFYSCRAKYLASNVGVNKLATSFKNECFKSYSGRYIHCS